GGREAERRVVVGGVVGVGAVVDDVVAGRAEVLDEGGLELEARVVGGDVQTHGRHHAASRGLVPRSPGGVRPRGAPPGDTAPMSSPHVDLIPRDALFGNPERAAVRLSPDGRHLSWLAPLDGVLNVWVAPADDPAAARPVTRDAARGIRAYFWSYRPDVLLYLRDTGGDEDFHLFRVDVTGGEPLDLTAYEHTRADVVHLSQRVPDEVLVGMNDRDAELHDVYRVDLVTGERTLVEENTEGFAGYLADDDYRLR